jgi:energy-coupling factor transport system permease protein
VSDFDLLGSLTIGQHLPTGSAVHRLHPGVKIAAAALLLAGLVVSDSLAALGVSSCLLLLVTAAARVRPAYALRGVRSALPLVALVAALQVAAIPRNDTGLLLARLGPVLVTTGDLHAAGVMVLRFASLILLVSLTTFVTGTRELVHGTEALVAPLSRVGLPGHEMALTLTVALRFLPILAMEAEHIARAQASRGAELGRHRGGILRRTRVLLPVLVPLFLSALRRAETLALAMESRGYRGGRGRTRLVTYELHARDALALAAAAAWGIALIVSVGLDGRLGALAAMN